MNKQEQLESITTAYTLEELKPVLGVSYRSLLQYIKDGKLAAVKIGGRWKVSADNLKAFIDGRTAV